MRQKTRPVTVIVMLILITLIVGLRVLAQESVPVTANSGKLHIDSAVWVGNTLLKPGMYQVQYTTEGRDSWIIFKAISMGYRGASRAVIRTERLRDEVARFKCTDEPAVKTFKHTRLQLGRRASGKEVVEAVEIAGEKIVHRSQQ